jgi:hypothetical protein
MDLRAALCEGKGHHRVDTTLGRRGCPTTITTNHGRRRWKKENEMIWEPKDGKDDAATVVNVEPFNSILPGSHLQDCLQVSQILIVGRTL